MKEDIKILPGLISGSSHEIERVDKFFCGIQLVLVGYRRLSGCGREQRCKGILAEIFSEWKGAIIEAF